MRYLCRTLLFALVLLFPASGQTPSLPDIDAGIEKARVGFGVPGLAVAIVKDGQVVLSKGYGVKEIGSDEPVDDKTLFAIASNTKAFTAALLAGLVDDGSVKWDDKVQTYLPWFQLYDPYVSADARITDLLSHRIGLGTFSGDLIWYGTPYSREEVVRRARFLPQAYPFRAGYGYSNIMYIAAGEIIERVTNERWEDVLQERIFDPLGMEHTVLSVDALEDEKNVATPHGYSDGTVRTYPWCQWNSTAAAGGIISCVSDLSVWMRIVLNRGSWNETTIYSDRQSRMMWTPHTNFVVSQRGREQNPYTNFSGYGLGWSLQDYDGYLLASHGGGYDGMFSQTLLVPDLSLGVVVLTNSMTGVAGAITRTVLDAYLQKTGRDYYAEGIERQERSREREAARWKRDDSLRVSGTTPSFGLAAYEGTYGGPMYGDATVTLESGALVLRILPNPDLVADLTHWHYDVFEVKWRKDFPWFGKGKVRFSMNEKAELSEFVLDVPNNDFWFTELEFKKK